MRKIAWQGMKGRKKDTILLAVVVSFSFLFIVIATTLYSSNNKTAMYQKEKMYGTWHAAYMSADAQMRHKINNLEGVGKVGTSIIIGAAEDLGYVATLDDNLKDMANFELYEGRLPEKADEIAIEYNQVQLSATDIKVGDKISAEIVIPLKVNDSNDYVKRIIKEKEHLIPNANNMTEVEKMEWVCNNARKRSYKPNTLESFDQTGISIRTNYICYFFRGDSIPDPKDMVENGFLVDQVAHITREFTVTGIINTYSSNWDCGTFEIANAFVTPETGRFLLDNGLLRSKEFNLEDYKERENLFICSDLYKENFYNTYKSQFYSSEIQNVNEQSFRRNLFTYPQNETSTDITLTYAILAFIFIATSFAVFQIFLTQMNRRMRKMALLRAVGAQKIQIAIMLLWEGIYILCIGLPFGFLIGVLFSYGIVEGVNGFGGMDLIFAMQPTLLLRGLVCGCISVFIGMAFPMFMAIRIPLIGTVHKPLKHKKVLHHKDKKVAIRLQSISTISRRHAQVNIGKTMLTFGISCIIITILLGSLFLCFLSFGKYRNEVISANRPGYGLEFAYGMQGEEIPKVIDELKEITGIGNIEVYKAGEQVSFTFSGIKDNKRISAFRSLLPESLLNFHFGLPKIDDVKEDDSKNDETIKTTIYGVDLNSNLFKRFENCVVDGKIDEKSFLKGEEVILLVPMYFPDKNSNGDNTPIIDENLAEQTNLSNRMGKYLAYKNVYDTSFDKRHATYYKMDNMIKPGDTVTLTTEVESYGTEISTHKIIKLPVRVSAVVSYFPETGIWPFTDTNEEYAIISSYSLVESVYPSTLYGTGGMTPKQLKERIKAYPTYQFGKTLLYIENNKEASFADTDSKLSKLADPLGFDLYNYREVNERLWNKAMNDSFITGLLGIASAGIAFAILYNILKSKAEQEQERTGILQAIGVTTKQIQFQQIKVGFYNGFISLVVAHIVLFIIVIGTTLAKQGGLPMSFWQLMQDIVYYQLWGYPWMLHGVVCIFYLIIIILMHTLSTKKIAGNMPVFNIRGLH